MNKLFKKLPWRIQVAFIRHFFRKSHVNIVDCPYIEGLLPQIDNLGNFFIGEKFCLRSFRLPQHLTVKPDAELIIGNYSCLNDGVNICATQSIRIGDHAKIGDLVYIYDSDFHAISPELSTKQASVHIGNNVWIGSKTLILPGAKIGDHSVIAAGSIVTGEIPERSLAAGTPARVIKTLSIPDNWVRA